MEAYLAFTVLIFLFGPADWAIPNRATLITFVVVNYAALWIGYAWGVRKDRTGRWQREGGSASPIRTPPALLWLIAVSMGFTVFADLGRLYAIRGSVGAAFASFLNPGDAYFQTQVLAQMDREGGIRSLASYAWVFRVSTVLAVLNGLYFPLALACWRQLKPWQRVLFFVTVLSAILFTVGLGLQSGIGNLVFASTPVVLYKIAVLRKAPPSRTADGVLVMAKRPKSTLLPKVLFATAVCLLVATVAYFQLNRADIPGRKLDAVKELGGQFAVPSERGIVTATGGRVNFGLVMALMYVSHGYEGLALSMEMPFEWTYGLGWSKGLQVLVGDYLGGPDLSPQTYVTRASRATGWPTSWWSTIFPWIASDTTFYGTALIMCLVGYVIARVWVDVIAAGNPIGFAVLAQMFTLVFMFTANNALAQTLEGLFSLIGVFALYAFSRRYLRGERYARRGSLAVRI